MPDYCRAHVPGGTYFFTVNTYRRQTFLTDVDVRSALREAIGTLRSTHPFVIEAWMLLPDHMHPLWTLPPGDEDFSTLGVSSSGWLRSGPPLLFCRVHLETVVMRLIQCHGSSASGSS